ncbi:MAG: thermonuclease family protein [Patescibacteria group bacterium]
MTKQKIRKLVGYLIFLVSSLLVTLTQFPAESTPRQLASSNQPGLYAVTKFYDGDTIAVNMDGVEEKVRMIGVDTPETHDPRKSVECFGKNASEFTRQLIAEQPVRLEADPQNSNRDRYNRLLRYVFLPDETLVNAEIIKQGYGFAYTSFPFTKLDEFRTLESGARAASKGLWSGCQPYIDAKGYIHSSDSTL